MQHLSKTLAAHTHTHTRRCTHTRHVLRPAGWCLFTGAVCLGREKKTTTTQMQLHHHKSQRFLVTFQALAAGASSLTVWQMCAAAVAMLLFFSVVDWIPFSFWVTSTRPVLRLSCMLLPGAGRHSCTFYELCVGIYSCTVGHMCCYFRFQISSHKHLLTG